MSAATITATVARIEKEAAFAAAMETPPPYHGEGPADWHVHIDGHPYLPVVPLTAQEAAAVFLRLAARWATARVEIRKVGRHRGEDV